MINLKWNERRLKLKNGLIIFCFLFSVLSSVKSLAQDTVFNYNPQWTKYYFRDNLDEPFQIDTTLNDFHRYSPAEQPFGYLHLGQLGAPETSMFLSTYRTPGLDIGFHQFDLYWLNSSGVKLYDTKRPYTSVYYQQGTKNEIKAAITHTQNILPQWSAGAEVNRYRTDGFYQRQLSRITNFNAFTRYSSINGFYQLEAAYVLNSIKVNENGGIADLSALTDSSIFDKFLIPVRLDSAMNYWKNDEVFIQNSFQFGPWEDVKKNDSTTVRMVKPKIRLQHFFEWERRGFYFTDAAVDNDFYEVIYLDSLHTRDTLKYDRFSNQISIYLPFSKDPLIKNFSAELFLRNDVYQIQREAVNEQIQNGIIGTSLQKYFAGDSSGKNMLLIKGTGQYNLTDFNKGDYLIDASASLMISRNNLVSFEILKSKNHPSLIQQNYFSNHFIWENFFVPSQTSSIKFYIRNERWKFLLRGELFTVKNYIYWNTTAFPAQYKGDLDGFAIFLQKKFTFKSFHFDNELQYQHFNNDSIVSFSPFFSRHSLYFEDKLFKGALTSKVGIDVRYTADYYGPAYMPETGQFYVQHSAELSYYPVADLFISIKVKGVRGFIMIQNIGQGFFAPVYFSAYRYPMPDRSFRLGLQWMFWN